MCGCLLGNFVRWTHLHLQMLRALNAPCSHPFLSSEMTYSVFFLEGKVCLCLCKSLWEAVWGCWVWGHSKTGGAEGWQWLEGSVTGSGKVEGGCLNQDVCGGRRGSSLLHLGVVSLVQVLLLFSTVMLASPPLGLWKRNHHWEVVIHVTGQKENEQRWVICSQATSTDTEHLLGTWRHIADVRGMSVDTIGACSLKITFPAARRDRGWDGWMASPTRWTWVWVGVGDGQGGLACCSPWFRRVGHNRATELN